MVQGIQRIPIAVQGRQLSRPDQPLKSHHWLLNKQVQPTLRRNSIVCKGIPNVASGGRYSKGTIWSKLGKG